VGVVGLECIENIITANIISRALGYYKVFLQLKSKGGRSRNSGRSLTPNQIVAEQFQSNNRNKMSSKQSVVIVGAGASSSFNSRGQLTIGIYGMSTALWMLREGGYEVTILDRCEELPALDAASTGVFSFSFLAPRSLHG